MTSPTLHPGLDDLRTRVSGTVTGPGDPGYDEARAIWNGMIDRRPAAVVRAAGTDDVAPTIGFAREHGLDLAVRGGGHNVAGNGTVDDGLVLDLADLHAVTVDPATATVRVEAGLPCSRVIKIFSRSGSLCSSSAASGNVRPERPTVGHAGGLGSKGPISGVALEATGRGCRPRVS